MAHVIELNDGTTRTLVTEDDLFDLVDEYLGSEVTCELKELLWEYEKDSVYEKELEELLCGAREYHREVMRELRTQAETITGLIRAKTIDRKALSAAAGKIGIITGREL